jgi:hypothetical protein
MINGFLSPEEGLLGLRGLGQKVFSLPRFRYTENWKEEIIQHVILQNRKCPVWFGWQRPQREGEKGERQCS